jgi:hypothetical protein
MADIPSCPNVREGKCERSDTIWGGETKDQTADIIFCRTCNLLWMISRPRTVGRARYENKIDKMQKATQYEKEQASRRVFLDLGRRISL